MKKVAKKYLKLLGFRIVKTFDACAPIPELAYYEKPVPKEIQLSEGYILDYQEDTRLIDDEKYHRVIFDSNEVYISEKTLNNKDLFRDPIETCFQVKLFDTLEDLNFFLEENSLKSDCEVQITTNNKFLLKYLRIGDENKLN